MDTRIVLTFACSLIAAVASATPSVSITSLTQSSSRRVTIEYDLADEPAVITVDIQTNGVSIGAENLNGRWFSGDVNRLVQPATGHKIYWQAHRSWPDHIVSDGTARAVISAYATNTPPNYMVVDLTGAEPVKYYDAEVQLPGGLLSNSVYRTTSLVMRRVNAAGVPWTMGNSNELGREPDGTSAGNRETAHTVTLDADYYIGVFPVTQAQYGNSGYKKWESAFSYNPDRAMRPAERVSFNKLRRSNGADTDPADNVTYDYPNPPASNSYLDRLRTATGIAFDLPSEAQWEFAAKCAKPDGTWVEGHWNDGSVITGTGCPNVPGRTYSSGGVISSQAVNALKDSTFPNQDTSAGTMTVGSYPCNAIGLYDMHGNVQEWTLDFYGDAETIKSLNGAVCPASNAHLVNGKYGRIAKGGSWNHDTRYARASTRFFAVSSAFYNVMGFRLCAPAIAVK